jgi:diguanylate cyclase
MAGAGIESNAPAASEASGEILAPPRVLRFAWIVLGLLVVAEAVHEIFNIGGASAFLDEWLPDAIVVAAAGICLARAAHEPHGRNAWLAFGVGLACWSAGSVLWSVRYGSNPNPPYPTASDALWLLWYPFTGLGVALLIRLRVTRFELHRWIDGVAAMLIVLAAGFALVLQSVAEHAGQKEFATIVDFSYPVLDMVLIGAILGVFALMAWRPERVWLWLGGGCVIMAIADAVFAVQEARGIASGDGYTFVWTAGAMLIAYAAWVPPERVRRPHGEPVGWRAIALPLAVQLLAACVQIYLLVSGHEVSVADRLVTIAVLLIASLQIVVSRPRGDSSPQ